MAAGYTSGIEQRFSDSDCKGVLRHCFLWSNWYDEILSRVL